VGVFCSFSQRSIKNPTSPEIFSLPNKSFDKEIVHPSAGNVIDF
jgi:hypothetical protein